MNLHKLIFTNNACYKAGRRITPQRHHGTLHRRQQPLAQALCWGRMTVFWGRTSTTITGTSPWIREVCVHAFIGKLADGTVATYQTLPWDHRGWHAGFRPTIPTSPFEICEDDLTDADYLDKGLQRGSGSLRVSAANSMA